MLSQKAKILSGYWIAIILLVIAYTLIFYNASQLNRQSKWISHSLFLINKLDNIVREVTEAETSFRGYVITKSEPMLDLYKSARMEIPFALNELKRMVKDNPEQLARLDTLRALLIRRMELMEININLFQQADLNITPQMESFRKESSNKMDSIRLFSNKMTNAESVLMESRSVRFSNFFRRAMNIMVVSLLIGVIALVYSLVKYSKENVARNVSDNKAKAYEKQLENNIEKLEVINAEIKELRNNEKFAATGRVARTIAHEVRNPLTNISLATEQLRETEVHNPESSLLLEMISRNTVRINQLVADLLNATRFTQLEITRVEVRDLLEDALIMARDRINLSNIKLERDYCADPCFIMADPPKMKVAFLNIILNAIEAMPENGGVLKLRTKVETPKCSIEITDNGIGMDEETIQSLFEPFFTKKPKGNGLGLTNTQNIILNHKGNIFVKSETGKGTTFRIVMDLA